MFARPERLHPSVADLAVEEFVARLPRARTRASPSRPRARHIYLEEPHGADGFWTRRRAPGAARDVRLGRRGPARPAGLRQTRRRRAARRAPGRVLHECGHVPQVELPEDTNGLIRELHRLRSGPRGGTRRGRTDRARPPGDCARARSRAAPSSARLGLLVRPVPARRSAAGARRRSGCRAGRPGLRGRPRLSRGCGELLRRLLLLGTAPASAALRARCDLARGPPLGAAASRSRPAPRPRAEASTASWLRRASASARARASASFATRSARRRTRSSESRRGPPRPSRRRALQLAPHALRSRPARPRRPPRRGPRRRSRAAPTRSARR